MLAAQILEAHVAPDIAIHHKLYAALGQTLGAANDDFLFELEVRDAIDQQAADAVVAVVHGDLVALHAQHLRCGHAAGTCANDPYAFLALARRVDRGDPAVPERGLGDVALDRADRDRAMARLFDDAIALAQPVLRADAPAYFRHRVGGRGNRVGFLQSALRCQLEPVGDIVL